MSVRAAPKETCPFTDQISLVIKLVDFQKGGGFILELQ